MALRPTFLENRAIFKSNSSPGNQMGPGNKQLFKSFFLKGNWNWFAKVFRSSQKFRFHLHSVVEGKAFKFLL